MEGVRGGVCAFELWRRGSMTWKRRNRRVCGGFSEEAGKEVEKEMACMTGEENIKDDRKRCQRRECEVFSEEVKADVEKEMVC